jgi:hypothetical protein
LLGRPEGRAALPGERPVAGQDRLADADPQLVNPALERLNGFGHGPILPAGRCDFQQSPA